ncbi:hypothetical protein BH23ACT9_BH23ACT9_38100 [soil metagenome]
MTRPARLIVMLLVSCVALLPTAATAQEEAPGAAEAFLAAMDAERAERGLPPLQVNHPLASGAAHPHALSRPHRAVPAAGTGTSAEEGPDGPRQRTHRSLT